MNEWLSREFTRTCLQHRRDQQQHSFVPSRKEVKIASDHFYRILQAQRGKGGRLQNPRAG